jgi:hypothetical protein
MHPERFICSDSFGRYKAFLIYGCIIVGHSLATTVAVLMAPAHKKVVGTLGVVVPIAALALSMRNTVTGEYDLYDDVLPILLMGVPTAICTVLVVRKLGLRHVA